MKNRLLPIANVCGLSQVNNVPTRTWQKSDGTEISSCINWHILTNYNVAVSWAKEISILLGCSANNLMVVEIKIKISWWVCKLLAFPYGLVWEKSKSKYTKKMRYIGLLETTENYSVFISRWKLADSPYRSLHIYSTFLHWDYKPYVVSVRLFWSTPECDYCVHIFTNEPNQGGRQTRVWFK